MILQIISSEFRASMCDSVKTFAERLSFRNVLSKRARFFIEIHHNPINSMRLGHACFTVWTLIIATYIAYWQSEKVLFPKSMLHYNSHHYLWFANKNNCNCEIMIQYELPELASRAESPTCFRWGSTWECHMAFRTLCATATGFLHSLSVSSPLSYHPTDSQLNQVNATIWN